MFDINLIADQRARKMRGRRMRRVTIYSLIGLIVGVGAMFGTMTVNALMLRGRIAEVDAELDNPELRQQLDHYYTLESQLTNLRPRVQLLERVHSSEFAWLLVAHDLGQAIPGDAWLTRFASKRRDKDHTITVAGVALTQRSVGDYMLALADQPWVKMPDLSFTRRKTLGGTEVMEYEINLSLAAPVGSFLE